MIYCRSICSIVWWFSCVFRYEHLLDVQSHLSHFPSKKQWLGVSEVFCNTRLIPSMATYCVLLMDSSSGQISHPFPYTEDRLRSHAINLLQSWAYIAIMQINLFQFYSSHSKPTVRIVMRYGLPIKWIKEQFFSLYVTKIEIILYFWNHSELPLLLKLWWQSGIENDETRITRFVQ